MPVDDKGYYRSEVKVITKLAPKVDDGIPMPAARAASNDKGYAATLRVLEVGQSVFLPTSRASAYGRTQLVRAERKQAGQPIPTFVMRAETGEGEVRGHRIWRAA